MTGELFEHHSAYMEIVPDGASRCRFVCVSDFLPNERMELVEPLVEQGARADRADRGAAEAPGRRCLLAPVLDRVPFAG